MASKSPTKFRIAMAIFACFIVYTLLFKTSEKTLEKRSSIGSKSKRELNVYRHSCEDLQKPDLCEKEQFELLTKILEIQMTKAKNSTEAAKIGPTCETNDTIANSFGSNVPLRMKLSEDHKVRLSQLLKPETLQMHVAAKAALKYMRKQLKGHYDTIIVTGVSSNHYVESRKHLKHLHKTVFPFLKNVTFKFVYYDLGLTKTQQQQISQECSCTFVRFPFELFPKFFTNLKCYSWKPFIISSLMKQAKTIIWMDSSVRFEETAKDRFDDLIRNTQEKGIQIGGPSVKTPFHTARSMYHWFGDEPCAYLQLEQFHAGFLFVKQDPFVQRVIIDSWTACAWNQMCICPPNFKPQVELSIETEKNWLLGKGKPWYGLRHLYDQSALSVIVHKVYARYYKWVRFDVSGHRMWFDKGVKKPHFSHYPFKPSGQ